ncbi:intercellular adhesion molecule 4-like [Girardinichthys multiradiatus]|uniref:intercellular adhesion molecule 4-like n=1 Tax=Girardinichthys multiradiatus TaxID=208333 RepID=UPI001FADA3C8|nr:intercellular adhesion molecule 4-like [Girardinichthys multiradiatus]
MWEAGWTLSLVLIPLIGSATSSPFFSPAPPFPSQISTPSPLPINLPALSLSFPSPTFTSSSTESMTRAECNLKISPSILVVRFGDPAKANCSKPSTGFPMLGWVDTQGTPVPTMESFLVWSVDKMTEWTINLVCYAISDQGGDCSTNLPLIVYKPPKKVSIQFLNHTGPMFERHQYSLQCTVQDVAPVGNLIVTFYRGQTPLGHLRSNWTTEKTPVNESFTLIITPFKEDNGSQYWCEAKLELGPAGPQHPPVETSQNLTVMVLWNPEPIHPTKLHMKEEKHLDSELKTNQQPLGSGTTNGYRGCFLWFALLAHLIN